MRGVSGFNEIATSTKHGTLIGDDDDDDNDDRIVTTLAFSRTSLPPVL